MLAEPLRLAAAHCRAGRFGDALAVLRKTRPPADRLQQCVHRVLLAETLERTGDRAAAAAHARAVLDERRLPPALYARCHLVLGLVAAADNAQAESLRQFQRAIRLATEARDDDLAARAQLRLLANLGDAMSPSAVHTLAAELKRRVAGAADVELLTTFHIELARLEATRARLRTAKRHLREASTLLGAIKNPWLHGKLSLHASAVAFLSSELADAVQHAHRALRQAEVSCDSQMKLAALLNAAAAELALGELEEAEQKFSQALAFASQMPYPRIGILLNFAILRLLQGRPLEAQDFLDAAMRLHGDLHSWWTQWIHEAKIWILREAGAWREIRASVEPALETVARSHQYAQAPLRLAAAEAALETQDAPAAIPAIAELDLVELPLHSRAELERIKGKAFAIAGDPSRAEKHFDRACRLSLLARDFAAFRRAAFDVARFQGAAVRDAELRTAWHRGLTGVPFATTSLAPRAAGASREGVVHSSIEAADLLFLRSVADRPHAYALEAHRLLVASGDSELVVAVARRPGHSPEVIATYGCSVEEARALARDPGHPGRVKLVDAEGWTVELIARPQSNLASVLGLAALQELVGLIADYHRCKEQERDQEALWTDDADLETWHGIWMTESTREIWKVARKIADTNLPVLITGETGTGKEVLARAIHQLSRRASRPFLPFNCKAVPRELLDSQLFGYRRGAFTGAYDGFPGLVRAATGGTLFLDEIGDLEPDLQPKLLRFLETDEILPLGETRPVKADARVVAATNSNLEQAVAEGRFREDLFYRLNVIRFHLPPLRERREEIPPLVQYFLRRHGEPVGKGALRISDEALEYLFLYHWPGNVRQLENEVRRIVALTERDGLVTPELLSPAIRAARRTVPTPAATEGGGPPRLELRLDQPLPAAVRQLEMAMITYALRTAEGRIEEAAHRLGLSRKGLFLKRRRLGFSPTRRSAKP